MTDVLTVDFECLGKHAVINIYSKFTMVSGDSGNGKSEFIYTCEQEIGEGNCHITCSASYDVYLVSQDDTNYNFDKIKERCIFVVDEISMRKTLNIKKMRTSNHLFICITRVSTICGNNPLKGSYTLGRKDDWFEFTQNTLPLYADGDAIDVIVTESAEDRSEHELLSVYTDKLVAARGRDNVQDKLLQVSGKVLVLMDLGNIDNSYDLLAKRCKENKEICVYDYLAFEELLLKSPLVSKLPEIDAPSRFDVKSLERYFEDLLSERTKNTDLAYTHGAPLPYPYLNKDNFTQIFDSDVGRALMHLLQQITLSNNSSFNSVEYLRNKAGDKFKYFTQLQIDSCVTQEDCDQLLQSLRWLD